MSMKTLGFKTPGDEKQLNLYEVPRPTPLATDVLVHVRGFSTNPADVGIRGGYPLPGLPVSEITIVGYDGSGVIESVGSEVTDFKAGDEVYFSGSTSRAGSYAEFIAVNHRLVAIKPKSVDHAVASSMPAVSLTAWQVLELRFGLKIPVSDAELQFNASKSILITAGAGGVGTAAIQIAKHIFKIGKVIASAGRPESIAWCQKYGADLVLDRSKDWKAQLEENGFKGVDYALVCSGFDDIAETLLSVINYGGSVCGISRTQASISLTTLMQKALTVSFIHLLPVGHDSKLTLLAKLVDDGVIKPWVGKRYEKASVDNIREAHVLQGSGSAIGKISFVADF